MTYNMQDIFNLIAETTNKNKQKLTVDTTISDLGLDSLDTVALLMKLEDTYGITLEDSYVNWNIGQLQDFIGKNASV